jgi:hypothetical protein
VCSHRYELIAAKIRIYQKRIPSLGDLAYKLWIREYVLRIQNHYVQAIGVYLGILMLS